MLNLLALLLVPSHAYTPDLKSSADGTTPFGGVKNAETPPESRTKRRRRAISLRVTL